MIVYNSIKKNEYYDSVTLMVFSKKIASFEGVEEAAVKKVKKKLVRMI